MSRPKRLDQGAESGRKLSQAVYDRTNAQGSIYISRLTGHTCICVYDHALPGLVATPVVEVMLLAGFVDALRELNVTLIATPQLTVETSQHRGAFVELIVLLSRAFGS